EPHAAMIMRAAAVRPNTSTPLWIVSKTGNHVQIDTISVPADVSVQMLVCDDQGHRSERVGAFAPRTDPNAVVAALRAHLDARGSTPAALDASLAPPSGVFWGTVTNSYAPQSIQLGPTNWKESGSATQSASVQQVEYYYIYYATGSLPDSYYVVLVQQVTSSPGAMIANDDNVRVFIQDQVGATVTASSSIPNTLLGGSPATTGSSPVVAELMQNIPVLTDVDGGAELTLF